MIPKMDDGENNGSKPYFLMDDLGGVYIYIYIPLFFGNTQLKQEMDLHSSFCILFGLLMFVAIYFGNRS